MKKQSKYAYLNSQEIKEFLENMGVKTGNLSRVEIIMDIKDVVRIKTERIVKICDIDIGRIKSNNKLKIK